MSPGRPVPGLFSLSRENNVGTSAHLHEIALATDTSVQELLRKALNDLFIKCNRPPIA